MTDRIKIGVLGGSGVYQVDGAKVLDELSIDTPYGSPSDKISICEISGQPVAFLPRHGKGHRLTPSEVPVHANIWALKSLGVDSLLAISAVGSLKEEYAPCDFVIPNQIIDRTRLRKNSFFGNGLVGHIGFADPFCHSLSSNIYQTLKSAEVTKIHKEVTYLCMEGPAFSTRAESHMYRFFGCGIIGMTALPEAKLAREAEMAYAMIAMVTDYDCWREEEDAVNVAHVLEYMKKNGENLKKILPKIISNIPQDFKSEAHSAAQCALITSPELIPEDTKKKLDIFYGKYWKKIKE